MPKLDSFIWQSLSLESDKTDGKMQRDIQWGLCLIITLWFTHKQEGILIKISDT